MPAAQLPSLHRISELLLVLAPVTLAMACASLWANSCQKLNTKSKRNKRRKKRTKLTSKGRHSASKEQRRKLQETMKMTRKRKRRARDRVCQLEEGSSWVKAFSFTKLFKTFLFLFLQSTYLFLLSFLSILFHFFFALSSPLFLFFLYHLFFTSVRFPLIAFLFFPPLINLPLLLCLVLIFNSFSIL